MVPPSRLVPLFDTALVPLFDCGPMKRLLILACSQRKSSRKGKVRAIDRYDGPTFRVLRKYLRERPDGRLSILVLSAKYGLISADQPIDNYDLRLTRERAERLRPTVLRFAAQVLSRRKWDRVGVCAGKDYRVALAGLDELTEKPSAIELIVGGQGPRLAALRKWLCSGSGAYTKRRVEAQ
jgi:hypothetical protein